MPNLTVRLWKNSKRQYRITEGVCWPKECVISRQRRPHVNHRTSQQTWLGHFDPVSPDSAPSDYHPFLHMNKRVGGKRFDDDDRVKEEVNDWLKKQAATFKHVKVAIAIAKRHWLRRRLCRKTICCKNTKQFCLDKWVFDVYKRGALAFGTIIVNTFDKTRR